jgi:hypothetical protein
VIRLRSSLPSFPTLLATDRYPLVDLDPPLVICLVLYSHHHPHRARFAKVPVRVLRTGLRNAYKWSGRRFAHTDRIPFPECIARPVAFHGSPFDRHSKISISRTWWPHVLPDRQSFLFGVHRATTKDCASAAASLTTSTQVIPSLSTCTRCVWSAVVQPRDVPIAKPPSVSHSGGTLCCIIEPILHPNGRGCPCDLLASPRCYCLQLRLWARRFRYREQLRIPSRNSPPWPAPSFVSIPANR